MWCVWTYSFREKCWKLVRSFDKDQAAYHFAEGMFHTVVRRQSAGAPSGKPEAYTP